MTDWDVTALALLVAQPFFVVQIYTCNRYADDQQPYYQPGATWPPNPPEPLFPLKSESRNTPVPPPPLPGRFYPFNGPVAHLNYYGANYAAGPDPQLPAPGAGNPY